MLPTSIVRWFPYGLALAWAITVTYTLTSLGEMGQAMARRVGEQAVASAGSDCGCQA